MRVLVRIIILRDVMPGETIEQAQLSRCGLSASFEQPSDDGG
jgi:hypothetical protein